jgi:hypothetical protein
MVWYAGASAGAGAQESTQQQVQANTAAMAADMAAIKADMAAIRARNYNKADHKELAPGATLTLPAGTYHKVSWSVAPTDRNNPDLNQFAKVSLGGGASYYANEAGSYTATEVDAVAFTVNANTARVVVIWEF